MAEERLRTWETLFRKALELMDSARPFGLFTQWTFGGGTVLMRRHGHRFSKDIDIFVPDPQYLGFVSPRLNDTAATMTGDYIEAAESLKLRFAEGEIDFISAGPLTTVPTTPERILGRTVEVETSTEIIAKKVWHRGANFKARDVLDLAMVAEREPGALREIRPVLRGRRDVILTRLEENDRQLRADFAQLELLSYRPSYDECVKIVIRVLGRAQRPERGRRR
jgi:hypothetical protein